MLLTNAYDPDPRVRQEALALIRMGCRVHILAWDRDHRTPASECIEDVTIERVHLKSRHGRGTAQLYFYILLYIKLLWRGFRTSWDVVHCHDLDTLPLGFVLATIKRKPLVYDAHESFTDMIATSVHPIVISGLVRLENFLIRRADLLITVGETLRRHFEERGARHSVVIGNWKRTEDYSRTEEQNEEVRRKLEIPGRSVVITCITNLLHDRKIEELLDAVDCCDDIYAVIGGKGTMETVVRERATRNPRIIYLGYVRPENIPSYTCASDVVYYGFDPHNHNAQFSAPNKLFEALAAGKPIITGDFGEIASVVRASGCGVILPAYTSHWVVDAIRRLRDPAVRHQMSVNAACQGRTIMNWQRGEDILHQEYTVLLHGSKTQAGCT